MTTASDTPANRRITITLDVAESGAVELARAARLAARLGAELEGVFVEDLDLLQVATLPFARELRSISLVSEALSAPRIERELRVLARRAEQALRKQAGQVGIQCSFRIWRGSLGSGLLTEFADADVLSLGRLGGLFAARRRLPEPRYPPIAVVTGESELGLRALDTAIELARDALGSLTVISAAEVPGESTPFARQLRSRLERSDLQVRFIRSQGISPVQMRQVLDAAGSSVLVLPGDHPFLQTTPLRQLVLGLGRQLLVVR